MKKRMVVLVLATMVFLVLAFTALAVDRSNTASGGSLTSGLNGRLTDTVAGSRATRAGNVTEVNVTTTRSTAKWAGYFGGVTTALRLGIGSDLLYDFGTGNKTQIKSIFAAPDTSFDFSNLLAGTAAGVDSAWGFSATDRDSATLSFNATTTVSTITTVPAVNLIAYEGGNGTQGGTQLMSQNNSIYKSGIFTDSASPAQEFDFAFGVAVNANKRDFRNLTFVDYELMVPVNTTVPGGQTYYFFLDVE